MRGNNTFTQQLLLSLFSGCFQTLIYRLRKHIPCIHDAEEKESITGVRSKVTSEQTEGKNQALVGAITFCGAYPGPRFEGKFRSANQMEGILIADGGKMADS